MGYIENNTIGGVPMPGPYSLYIYFSDSILFNKLI